MATKAKKGTKPATRVQRGRPATMTEVAKFWLAYEALPDSEKRILVRKMKRYARQNAERLRA
jgi:hypothetical protein